MAVNSWDLDHMDIPARCLNYAAAYLEAAKVLCNHMIAAPEIETYALGSACMFNARLAVELFLKATILRKNKDASLHHVLEKLGIEYHLLYPESEYSW